MNLEYDVIVIGGGHAGAEAAWAACNALSQHGQDARATEESRVALITMDPSKIGAMSCNPAIGGLAKGQIVREIDAMGGIMALATDATGIQFRILNMSKGPAVRGPRAQCDKYAYAAEIQRLLSTRTNLEVIAGTIDDLIVENGEIVGVHLPTGSGYVYPTNKPVHLEGKAAQPIYPTKPTDDDRNSESIIIKSRAVILTTGTFMRALMHTGEHKAEGGRVNEGSAIGISAMLKKLGFELGRLKTGTPPRLNAETINFTNLIPQFGDDNPKPFSDISPSALPHQRFPILKQAPCHITSTTAEAHELIRRNLHRAPMYSGDIKADSGPRYCPSIEDKVVRFAHRDSHHVFLEPESLHTNEIYCNGISTSLPTDIQEQVVRMMPGCENAEILKWGYAVEYDMVWPHQINATCMTKRISGLYLAGQINGTSGYEEAAGQGLLAGINAARRVLGEESFVLHRNQAYIGVMMDDLVTKQPREPYRMFTSRAEYRLLLRPDNADSRLTPIARELGLIDDFRWEKFTERKQSIESLHKTVSTTRVNGKSALEYAKKPRISVEEIQSLLGDSIEIDRTHLERVMVDVQYEGYIARQHAEIKRLRKTEQSRIPDDLNYKSITGLRNEAADVMSKFRPTTMGQARRLAGVNPADLTLLAIAIRRDHEKVNQ